jgi:hypothetical protein
MNHKTLGLFRFFPLAFRRGHFLEAVDRVSFAEQTALVAQPLRALLDIICLRKPEAFDIGALTRSMRIDMERLRRTKPAAWRAVERVYAHKRMAIAIRALKEAAA